MIPILVKKDVKLMLRQPLTYLILAGFLAIVNYLFVILMLSIGMDGFMPIVLDNINNLLLVVVPVLILKFVGEEYAYGTDEWLLTQPVSPTQYVMAKFSVVVGAACFFVGLTTVDLLVLALFCSPSWASILTGYLGSVLFAAVLSAIGIWISVASRSIVVGAGGTFVTGLFILAMSWLADSPIGQWVPWLNRLMIGQVLTESQEGLIRISALALIFTVIGVSLVLARSIVARRPLGYRILVIAIGIAFLVLTSMIPGKWELAESQWTQLSQETHRFLKQQRRPVKIIAWVYFDSYEHRYLRRILESYHTANPLIQVEFIDPDRHPQQAGRYHIDGPGTLTLESGTHVRRAHTSEIFQFDDRQKLEVLNAEPVINRELMALESTRKFQVGVLEGHGEKAISGGSAADLDKWSELLSKNDIEVSTVNLALLPVIPRNLDEVVIAGAGLPLSDRDRKSLSDFNRNGGAVLILSDPSDFSQDWTPIVPLVITPNVIVDESRSFYFDLTDVIPVAVDHPLNTVLTEKNLALTFPVSTALWPLSQLPENWNPLFITSPHAWLAHNVTRDIQSQFDKGDNQIYVTAAEYRHPPNGPVIVIGDSDWISNRSISDQYNAAYSLRLVTYLTDHTLPTVGKIRSRGISQIVILPGEDKMIFVGLVLIIPLLIAGIGLGQWINRRGD